MKIHFIGIGGIGVSALAEYYLKKGHKVTGSDLASSEITNALKKQGVKIFIGKHKSKNLLKDTDLVVYTPACQKNNPELLEARTYNMKARSYPEALGELTKEHFTIAVSGTHGKSTTSSMIGLLLAKAGLDPTVIVGTKVKEFNNSNCRVGKSKYLVIEADEHFASFLNYWPKIIVLTNIEKDHLDYYKNLNNILKTFKKYISHLPSDGLLIANADDNNIRKILSKKTKVQKYSLKSPESKKLKEIMAIPGKHNISNALAALKVAKSLNVPDKVSFKALSEYKGSWRRFEVIKNKPYILMSDYAHHPTEIKAALAAIKEKWPEKNLKVIFQPHQYQRTYYLFDEFTKAFDKADEIIFCEIYDVAGREEDKISKKISSENLTNILRKKGKNAVFVKDFRNVPKFLEAKRNDIVVVMGAGDIYRLADLL